MIDHNRDWHVDFAPGNFSVISVFLGKRDGSFYQHTEYATGGHVFWVTIVDVNGKQDAALHFRTSGRNL